MTPRSARLLGVLEGHDPADDLEAGYLAQLRDVLVAQPDPFGRDQCALGHFTASAFVLHPDGGSLLLIFHSKLHRWLQPGGHVEADDPDLLDAARREVHEETGVVELDVLLSGRPLDVDVHPIPARGSEAAHLHFDVRFLFQARTGVATAGSDAADVRWVRLEAIDTLETDESVRRAVRKIRSRKTVGN